MPRRPHADLKTEIIAEAVRIVRADGAQALTARRLAQAGGCSVGTLYNLFGDLDGVVRAMNRQTVAALEAALAAALEAAQGSRETRLLALADAYLDFALANPALWDALFRYRLDAASDETAAEDMARLFALLRGVAAEDVEDDALWALWAAVHGVVELGLGQRLFDTGVAAQRRYVHLIVRAGLLGIEQMRAER